MKSALILMVGLILLAAILCSEAALFRYVIRCEFRRFHRRVSEQCSMVPSRSASAR